MSEWVSIKDRWPNAKETGSYLLLKSDGTIVIAYWHNACFEFSGSPFSVKEPMTHWAEMPKHPKQDGPFTVYKGEFERLYLAYLGRVGPQLSKNEDWAFRVATWLNARWPQEEKCVEEKHRPCSECALFPCLNMIKVDVAGKSCYFRTGETPCSTECRHWTEKTCANCATGCFRDPKPSDSACSDWVPKTVSKQQQCKDCRHWTKDPQYGEDSGLCDRKLLGSVRRECDSCPAWDDRTCANCYLQCPSKATYCDKWLSDED